MSASCRVKSDLSAWRSASGSAAAPRRRRPTRRRPLAPPRRRWRRPPAWRRRLAHPLSWRWRRCGGGDARSEVGDEAYGVDAGLAAAGGFPPSEELGHSIVPLASSSMRSSHWRVAASCWCATPGTLKLDEEERGSRLSMPMFTHADAWQARECTSVRLGGHAQGGARRELPPVDGARLVGIKAQEERAQALVDHGREVESAAAARPFLRAAAAAAAAAALGAAAASAGCSPRRPTGPARRGSRRRLRRRHRPQVCLPRPVETRPSARRAGCACARARRRRRCCCAAAAARGRLRLRHARGGGGSWLGGGRGGAAAGCWPRLRRPRAASLGRVGGEVGQWLSMGAREARAPRPRAALEQRHL